LKLFPKVIEGIYIIDQANKNARRPSEGGTPTTSIYMVQHS